MSAGATAEGFVPLMVAMARVVDSALSGRNQDDQLLQALVRTTHGFSHAIEAIRVRRGFKPILSPSQNQKSKAK